MEEGGRAQDAHRGRPAATRQGEGVRGSSFAMEFRVRHQKARRFGAWTGAFSLNAGKTARRVNTLWLGAATGG